MKAQYLVNVIDKDGNCKIITFDTYKDAVWFSLDQKGYRCIISKSMANKDERDILTEWEANFLRR